MNALDYQAGMEDQFYQGKSSIFHSDLGKGTVTYVGAWSDRWDMEYDLLRKVYGKVLGDLPFDMPPYGFAHYRQGLWVAVNYTDKVVTLPVPKDAKVLIGDRALPPAGVLVCWCAGVEGCALSGLPCGMRIFT